MIWWQNTKLVGQHSSEILAFYLCLTQSLLSVVTEGVKLADWYEPGKQKLTPAQTDLLLRLSSTLTGADAHIMHSILSQYADPTHKRKLNLDK